MQKKSDFLTERERTRERSFLFCFLVRTNSIRTDFGARLN